MPDNADEFFLFLLLEAVYLPAKILLLSFYWLFFPPYNFCILLVRGTNIGVFLTLIIYYGLSFT
jgi:hypothetical protein